MIAFDTETFLREPGIPAPKGVCISWSVDGYTAQVEKLRTEDIKTMLVGWLEGNEVLALHNAVYDFGVICVQWPDLVPLLFAKLDRGEFWDTQIAATLDGIARGTVNRDLDGEAIIVDGEYKHSYSLASVVKIYLDRDDAKDNDEYRKRYGELDPLPIAAWPAEAVQYPKDDAINTWLVADVQRQHSLNREHMALNCRAHWALHLATCWGLVADAGKVLEFDAATAAKLQQRVAEFQKHGIFSAEGKKIKREVARRIILGTGGDPLSLCIRCSGSGKVTSPKSGKPINCKACGSTGLKPGRYTVLTGTGDIAAGKDQLLESDDEVLHALAQGMEVEKLRSTYLPFVRSATKVPCNVESNVLLETGRTSFRGCMQTTPRNGGVREVFVAPKGKVLCSVDYSALELCTLAQVTKEVCPVGTKLNMLEEINRTKNPGSLHGAFAAHMIRVSVEEFAARLKAKDEDAKIKRQMAKAANFGFPGGMGVTKLVIAKRSQEGFRFCVVAGVNKHCKKSVLVWKGRPTKPVCPDCVTIAEELREAWFERFTEMPVYFQWVNGLRGLKENDGVIHSPVTGFIRGGLSYTNACNHSFQHLGAWGAKDALWQVSRACYTDKNSALYGSRVLVFAHDEIITEVDEQVAHEAALEQSKIMVSAMKIYCKDVHIEAEPALMRSWSKKAESCYSNGRLIPFEEGAK